ncbi:MAG: VWA domain-containing protein [Caldilineaceae bacterium]
MTKPIFLSTLKPLILFSLLTTLLFPQIASAHDINAGRIQVTLAGAATGPYEVTLTARATPGIPVPLMQMKWGLLDGGELLDGSAETSWDLPPEDVPVEQIRRVHLPGPGVYRAGVSAILPLGDTGRFADSAVLFLIVDEGGNVTISARDPNAVSPMGSIMPESNVSQVQAAAVTAPNGDPCVTVSGVIQRIERTPTQSKYAADRMVPVRSALVEVREEDTLFDDSYGEMLTDDQGRYSFSFCDDDGLFDDELEVYIRLHAVIRAQGVDIVEVQEDGLIPPEDVYEFDTTPFDTEGGAYERNIDLTLEQSGIMNIADAILDAWTVWNNNGGAVGDDAIFAYQAEINWEAGDDDDKSYYNGYVWDQITIADGPSDPDQWDDSVIIHEWTHQADDNYGCDDNPGGDHSSSENLGDLELAWSEGYANYNQSSVRTARGYTDGNWYLDGDSMGVMSGYNLETRHTFSTTLNTSFNEAAIAAMLWDLEDMNDVNDVQDRVGYGPAPVQQVFTDPHFSENGDIFDDTCTAFVYLWSWFDTGKPLAGVGALVQQNIGIRPGFLGAAAASTGSAVNAAAVTEPVEASAAPVGGAPEDFRWWKNLTWVVDNSASMAESGKLDAAKTVMKEQVNDLAPEPNGTEFNVYTFNNTSVNLQQPVSLKFYADLVNPAIDSLTTISAPDADCTVGALNAMAQAARQQKGGDVWLYTDRASSLFPTIENAKQLLNTRQIKGSFAMLGGCAAVLPAKMSDVTGGEISYLGKAANGSQSTGIVPYLLTSLGTGGQFIYVREDQLGSAADILRAQVANSAGAGKWSDYVSDGFTYRWDRLEAGEYQWFPAESLGQPEAQLPTTGYAIYTMPEPFNFYGGNFTSVGVSQDGFVELDPCTTTTCVITRLTFYFLDVLNNDMQWADIPKPPALASAASADEANVTPACNLMFDGNPATDIYGPQVCVWSANLGFEWHIISVQGVDQANRYRAYQIWFNTNTGEIRYQYDRLNGEAANAEIGLRTERESLIIGGGKTVDKFLVSNRDAAGASNGMGYKFTPAPPQPSRVYTVTVDALMEGVGFLQTGYSGRFEPMVVRDPAGNPVNCADTANVLCITMDNVAGDRMVQYVQVNVNGNTGEWTATIDAQEGAEGTFTFSGLAASSIQASTVGERGLRSFGPVRISTRLGGVVEGNVLSAWLQRPNGERFGSAFSLFDDGAHGDGRLGDGIFSAPDVDAPGEGVGYLWVQGMIDGVSFTRSDPVPYNFQPVSVVMINKAIDYYGDDSVYLPVQITNHDSVQQCFHYGGYVTVPADWGFLWLPPPGDDGTEQFFGVCIPAGATINRELLVYPAQAFKDSPSLTVGEVNVAFVERERGAISDSDGATITRRRGAAQLTLTNPLGEMALRPTGTDTTTLTLVALDAQGLPVADHTIVNLTTDLGTVELGGVSGQNIDVVFDKGQAAITFTAPNVEGVAIITATIHSVTASANVYVRKPGVSTIELTATPTDLTGNATASTLVATVRDVWGDPVAGADVRIGVSDDSGTQGTIGGSQVVTGTTNASGQLIGSFGKAINAGGAVNVRAEYFINEAGAIHVVADDSQMLLLGALAVERATYLPLIMR